MKTKRRKIVLTARKGGKTALRPLTFPNKACIDNKPRSFDTPFVMFPELQGSLVRFCNPAPSMLSQMWFRICAHSAFMGR